MELICVALAGLLWLQIEDGSLIAVSSITTIESQVEGETKIWMGDDHRVALDSLDEVVSALSNCSDISSPAKWPSQDN